MASRSTRNKVRHQAKGAYENLVKAQKQMVTIGVMADNRPGYIEDNLPQLVAITDALIQAWGQFYEGL